MARCGGKIEHHLKKRAKEAGFGSSAFVAFLRWKVYVSTMKALPSCSFKFL